MLPRQETDEHKADRLSKFIRDYYMEWAIGPSWKDMAKGIGVSEKTLPKLLQILKDQGRAIYRKGRRRQTFPKGDDD